MRTQRFVPEAQPDGKVLSAKLSYQIITGLFAILNLKSTW
ncbi:hypothetical protein A33Q_1840 [Indibacter alkaliphilus LW1]|uniref:Uncharacterized protein n=1 Tax=Indibacter alkaliphilus (strain CCUG 57479 / KCTC 22604 / LW1) TaxID=1189612 RepID=S2DCL3_INDAL|nr:hypothetical protein A33Q_1840 [Indibacter alkaliphilus LW1]